MAEITTASGNNNKRSFSRSVNRRSTRVDLTPMVDLGFLLITFFVFTSTMLIPTTMSIVEPRDGPPKPVGLSGAMTIILGRNHQLYYYYGLLDEHGDASQISKTNFKQIRSLIIGKKKTTKLKDLMYIIKADKHSTFGDDISILDEMTICNILPGHYVEVDITEREREFCKF
ncbi:MAG: biopolymer transporter ExbD [Ferruginibacter sp.]